MDIKELWENIQGEFSKVNNRLDRVENRLTTVEEDVSVLKDDVKGFYNAVGQLNNTDYFETNLAQRNKEIPSATGCCR